MGGRRLTTDLSRPWVATTADPSAPGSEVVEVRSRRQRARGEGRRRRCDGRGPDGRRYGGRSPSPSWWCGRRIWLTRPVSTAGHRIRELVAEDAPGSVRGHSPCAVPETSGSVAFGLSGFSFIWGQPLSAWCAPELFGAVFIK